MEITGKDFENDDYSMPIKIKDQSQEISLSLSDDLETVSYTHLTLPTNREV